MVKLYLVGGYVRDLQMNTLLGTPMPKGKDKDYAVEASSYEEMREWLISNGAMIKVEAPEYFTIRAMLNGEFTDFTLCRKESDYTDGRHPDKVLVGNIYEDLSRRDFTINAMAIDCNSGKLLDPWNGKEDILNKRIRCVGNASIRMQEDYLRILRAMRFSITLGFKVDVDIISCMLNDYYIYKLMHTVSEDRIREELYKMFRYDTLKTMRILEVHSTLRDNLFSNNVWLKPTMEKRG